MNRDMPLSDLGLNEVEVIDLDDIDKSLPSGGPSSSTSGGGLELLMNDKRLGKNNDKTKSKSGLTDIETLEREVDEMGADARTIPKMTRSNIFDMNLTPTTDTSNIKAVSLDEVTPDTTTSSRPSFVEDALLHEMNSKTDKTWDGFGKFNEMPMDPNQEVELSKEKTMSKEELLREKFKFLRKLEGLEGKGVALTKKYNMDSDLAEMQGEYEMIVAEKEKDNSIKFQGKMLMAAVTGLEFLNNKLDPFDINLDGWGEQVQENSSDYDEIFAELHEKYHSKANMAPELKLLFALGGSAIMVHMTNSMFKSSMPGMDDVMRQNPELAKQFTQAAVNSMGQSNPGMASFVNGRTQQQAPPPPPPPRAPTTNSGPNMSRTFAPPTNNSQPNTAKYGDIGGMEVPMAIPRQSRPDMQGPKDISSILSNIKTKQGIGGAKPQFIPPMSKSTRVTDSGSNVSIQELKEMQMDISAPGGNRKRGKSEKKVMSLNLD